MDSHGRNQQGFRLIGSRQYDMEMKRLRKKRSDFRTAILLLGLPVVIAFIGLPLAGVPITRNGMGVIFSFMLVCLPFALLPLLVITYQNQDKRWKRWLILTIAIGIGSFILNGLLICGCHFHPSAVLVMMAPVLWAGYALGTYGDRREQIVGWMAFAVAVLSLWIGFESNLIFALR